jgi:hypothetical protein
LQHGERFRSAKGEGNNERDKRVKLEPDTT